MTSHVECEDPLAGEPQILLYLPANTYSHLPAGVALFRLTARAMLRNASAQ